MKKRLIAAFSAILIIGSFASFTAYAETTPMDEPPVEVTEDVFATEEPFYTEATDFETEPYTQDYTEEYTEVETTSFEGETTPTDYTDPSATSATETTVPSTTVPVTEVHTNPPEPTEPDENATYSDYQSPDPVYTPADQDFDANNWQEIKLDLEASPSNGKGNFDFIQKNNTKGNDSIMHFLIIGIVLIFLSIAGFTFVILYKPKRAATTPCKRSTSAQRRSSSSSSSRRDANRRPRREAEHPTYNPDDYNDGF